MKISTYYINIVLLIFFVKFISRSKCIIDKKVGRRNLENSEVYTSIAGSGGDFVINEYKTNDQQNPTICKLGGTNSGFVVSWKSWGSDSSSWGVVYRIFNNDGTARTGDLLANTIQDNSQSDIGMCCLEDGDFVIVWESNDSGGWNVYGRRFNHLGTPKGDQFSLSSSQANWQGNPKCVGIDKNIFYAVWHSDFPQADNEEIYGRMFNGTSGMEIEEIINVNQTGIKDQRKPHVTMLKNGKIVVSWSSFEDDGDGWGVYMRCLGDYPVVHHQVNMGSVGNQEKSDIVALEGGGFVIAFESNSEILYRVFNDECNAVSKSDFKANTWPDIAGFPNVLSLPNGDFMILWYADGIDLNGTACVGRVFNPIGTPRWDIENVLNEKVGRNQFDCVGAHLFDDTIAIAFTSWDIDLLPLHTFADVYGRLLVLDWECYAKHKDDHHNVCSGRGNCIGINTCHCFNESVQIFEGSECENVHCADGFLSTDEENVCSGVGKCNFRSFINEPYTLCDCVGPNYGRLCQERIVSAKYNDENTIEVKYFVDKSLIPEEDSCSLHIVNVNNDPGLFEGMGCSWEIKDNKTQKFVVFKKNIIIIMPSITIRTITNSSQIVTLTIHAYHDFTPLIIISISIVLGIFLVIVVIVVFILSIVLIKQFVKMKKKLDKVKEIDDEELSTIVAEKRAEKKLDLASLKINKALFVVDFDSVTLKKTIGSGGSDTTVYLGLWSGNKVAFKVFKSGGVFQTKRNYDEFEREVGLMSSISHPNILQFFGASLKPPRVGIVMEYCENGDIMRYFGKNDRSEIPLLSKLDMLKGCASAFEYLHSKNIIHRDVKSQNILLTDNLVPKIADFGLSRLCKDMEEYKTKRIGTSYYMAPEVSLGLSYSEKADVFSFSIVVWEVLHHSFRPFANENSSSVSLELKVANNVDFRPIIDEKIVPNIELQNLMKNLWEHDPKQRNGFIEIKKILTEIYEKESKI